MKFLVAFLFFVVLILWMKNFYWRHRSRLLELRLRGEDPESLGLFEAWLDGKIESDLQRKKNP